MAPQYLQDGSLDFLGGQDSSKAPDKVPPNAYFAGINVTSKQGPLGPRSGLRRLELQFTEETFELPNKYTRSYEEIFHSCKYQAIIPYGVGSDAYMIMVVSGLIYLINTDTLSVVPIPIKDGSTLDQSADRINWSLAGKFVVIFDYPAYPVIIEGSTARRANPDDFEIPISVLGAYNQNRLFIANAGNEFTASDPSGSLAAPNAPITFQEIIFANSAFVGESFQLPTNLMDAGSNEITAFTFLQFTDTSTGIGPLLIATKKAIYSYQTQNPRLSWKAGQFGTAFVYDAGIAGSRAFVNVNSDLFFLAPDGTLRTASMSRDEQGKWSRVPISREVQNWLKFYDKSLTKFGALGYFDNKIMVCANPYRNICETREGFLDWDVAHAGLVVLSLENISTLGQTGQPSWDGLWTGIRPMDFCVSNDRCFIVSKDFSRRNEIYEVTPETTYDRVGLKTRINRARVYTREYSFESEFQDKEAHSIDLSLANLSGEVSLDVKFRPSHASRFLPWKTYKHNAVTDTCKVPVLSQSRGFLSQDIGTVNLGAPEAGMECDSISQKIYRRFRKVQLLLDIKGKKWNLDNFRVKAIQMPQTETSEVFCVEQPPKEVVAECNDDWMYEEI